MPTLSSETGIPSWDDEEAAPVDEMIPVEIMQQLGTTDK